MRRAEIEVDGCMASYLTVDGGGPIVLLLHGTYWSRVWSPVLDHLADAGLQPIAVDFPGCGRSSGELTLETAAVPQLVAWVARFLEALSADQSLLVAGHDIGGAVAQRLLTDDVIDVRRLALVNSVTYDSWPVPGVARFRDQAVVRETSADDIVRARRQALTRAIARPMIDGELEEYLSPWQEPRVARSWMALAGAADSRYTLELLPALVASRVPKLLVWGEDDPFQPLRYAERFATEMPETALARIRHAGHIPMENDPDRVGRVLADFFAG